MATNTKFLNTPSESSIDEARTLVRQCAEPCKAGELVRRPFSAHHDVSTCPFLEREIFGMVTRGGSMPTKWTDSGAAQRKRNSPKP